MRELETSSTVIWPSWCYTGDLDPKQRGRMNGPSPTTGSTAIDILNNNNTTTNNNSSSTGASSNSGGSVKAERFSPPTGDNNSTSSRSGTPVSSYEGVGGGRGSPMALSLSQARERDPLKAMEQATSRNYSDFMRSLAAKYNHTNPNEQNFFSYFSGTGVPSGASLPNRNGYDPRSSGAFSAAAFKAAGASAGAPFLMTPLAVNAAVAGQATAKESGNAESAKSSDSSASGGDSAATNRWSFGANPFAAPGPPVYPPGIDMSSTQALINMVRTASAQSANQLETYLKGIKRGAENPLDLSATKKVRKSGAGLSLSESLYGDALLGLPMLSALNRASKDLLPTTHRLQTKSPKPSKTHTKNNHNSVGATLANNGASNSSSVANNLATNSPVTISPVTTSPVTNRPQCVSLCSDKPCGGMTNSGVSGRINAESAESGSAAEIASWSVDDVANFVGTIDICAEYSGNFRDQRIDGSALPLLTETHLTSALQMKLGPALKLRSVLSRRLGHCAVCLHCVHCHGSQASLGGPQALLGTTGPTGTQALLGTTGPTGTQALLGATGPTGTQALLTTSSPQALIAGGSQGGSQAFSASRGQSPQALLGTTGPQASQPPPSTPSPKPLTRPSSTGN